MLPTRPSHTVPRLIIRLLVDGVNELTALAFTGNWTTRVPYRVPII